MIKVTLCRGQKPMYLNMLCIVWVKFMIVHCVRPPGLDYGQFWKCAEVSIEHQYFVGKENHPEEQNRNCLHLNEFKFSNHNILDFGRGAMGFKVLHWSNCVSLKKILGSAYVRLAQYDLFFSRAPYIFVLHTPASKCLRNEFILSDFKDIFILFILLKYAISEISALSWWRYV